MILTGLLVLCCTVAGFLPVMQVRASSTGLAERSSAFFGDVWSWTTTTARSVGTFFSSVYGSIRDFFASGQALSLLESAAQSIDDFAVRLFVPLAARVLPLLQRVIPGLSATRELVAIWIFWIAVVLLLIVLILILRPRRTTRRRLPKASPKTAGQNQNSIEFGLVEEGPPAPKPLSEQLAQHEQPSETSAVTAASMAPEQPSSVGAGSPSIPEISLEPLGFFGKEAVAEPEAQPTSVVSTEQAAPATPETPPLLEFGEPVAEAETPAVPVEPIVSPPVEVPSKALLEAPATESQPQEPVAEVPPEPFIEPDLTPIGQAVPPPVAEAVTEAEGPVEPLGQPVPATEMTAAGEVMPEQRVQPVAETEPVPSQAELYTASESQTAAETSAVVPQEAQAAPSDADVLSHLLEEEEAFQQLAKPANAPARAGTLSPRPAVQPSMFAGDVDLDNLLQEGVVSDAAALGQLFSGGYRNRISKLAISAKDLQNVPEEIRNVVKLTLVALSPIELSIARDLAMRLEAPGFVGEALLVARKMGYQNYLTTYKNISRNYKDVSIIETVNLKTPPTTGPDSGDGLISFS